MMFDVEQMIGTVNNQRYPYKWRVGVDSADIDDYVAMKDWLTDNQITFIPAGSAIYFKTREDVTLFLLRWS